MNFNIHYWKWNYHGWHLQLLLVIVLIPITRSKRALYQYWDWVICMPATLDVVAVSQALPGIEL